MKNNLLYFIASSFFASSILAMNVDNLVLDTPSLESESVESSFSSLSLISKPSSDIVVPDDVSTTITSQPSITLPSYDIENNNIENIIQSDSSPKYDVEISTVEFKVDSSAPSYSIPLSASELKDNSSKLDIIDSSIDDKKFITQQISELNSELDILNKFEATTDTDISLKKSRIDFINSKLKQLSISILD
jgi:hypothetical protein